MTNRSLPIVFFMFCVGSRLLAYTHEVLNYNPETENDPARYEAYVAYPDDWTAEDKRPAIIFFHGGAWTSGGWGQFSSYCNYFADRGVVAFSATYNFGRIAECVKDTRSFVRWVKANAGTLGVDPERIVIGGSSAGAHLAACTYTAEGVDHPRDDLSISTRPELLILLSGALSLNSGRNAQLVEDVGETLAARCLPNERMEQGAPPSIILYGTDDGYRSSGFSWFHNSRYHQVRSDLWYAPDQAHGFETKSDSGWIDPSLVKIDAFLVEFGILPPTGVPAVDPEAPRFFPVRIGGFRGRFLEVASVLASSERPDRPAARMIDGSGLSDGGKTLESLHSNAPEDNWQAAVPFNEEAAFLEFDFGETVDFTDIHIWGGTISYLNGVAEAEVWVTDSESPMEGDYELVGRVFPSVLLPDLEGGPLPVSFEVAGEGVRKVKLVITRVRWDGGAPSFGEIRFSNRIENKQSYSDWRATIPWVQPEDGDPLSDPDEDSVVNVLEYVYGQDPLTPDDSGVLRLEMDEEAGRSHIQFQIWRTVRDLELTLQVSEDLLQWQDRPDLVPLPVTGAGNESVALMQVSMDVPGFDGPIFFRLRVKPSATW